MDNDRNMYAYMRAYKPKEDQIAVVRGLRKISYSGLDRAVRRIAGGLYGLGVRKGDVVMASLPNIVQAVELLYATAILGAVFSPVHPLIAEKEFSAEVALQRPKVIALSDINLSKFTPYKRDAKVVYCPYLLPIIYGLSMCKEYEEYDGDGDIPALYMRSGGTSGVPKTVVLSAKAANALVTNLLDSIPYEFDQKDGMLVTLPMFHGFGLLVGVHATLSTNMKAVLIPKFSGKRTLKSLKRTDATTMIAVPRMLNRLLLTKGFCGKDISTLKNVYVGGEQLDDDVADRFDSLLAESGASARIQQGYGLTEVGSVCALSPRERVRGSVGRALKKVRTVVVDQDQNVLPDGETGELLVSTDQMLTGYLYDEQATKDAICEINGERYLRTGDMFRREGDDLFYVCRKKRLIKISGMNVFPTEIERVARELSFVNDCVAYEVKIEGKTYIKLLVEGDLSNDQIAEVRERVKRDLSHWHVPRIIECESELPRTSIGKIDFLRLK